MIKSENDDDRHNNREGYRVLSVPRIERLTGITQLILTNTQVGGYHDIPISQMKKSRSREVTQLAQDLPARQWGRRAVNRRDLIPQRTLLPATLFCLFTHGKQLRVAPGLRRCSVSVLWCPLSAL